MHTLFIARQGGRRKLAAAAAAKGRLLTALVPIIWGMAVAGTGWQAASRSGVNTLVMYDAITQAFACVRRRTHDVAAALSGRDIAVRGLNCRQV
jgi:hypothetical protein